MEIDNAVRSAKGKEALDADLPYVNGGNKYRVGFAKTSRANKLVRFQLGQARVDFGLVDGKNVPAVIKDNKVAYPGIYPDTDLVYYTDHSGIKEEWILKKYNGQARLTMTFDVQNAEAQLQKDGSIRFVDKRGKELFFIPRPFMEDAALRSTDRVKLELRKEGSRTYLDLILDEEWLKDPERAYPVKVDPSLVVQGTYDTFDSFVSESQPTANFGGYTYLITGTHPDYGKTRSYIKFSLKPLLSGAQITSAKLTLSQYLSTTEARQVNVYPVTSAWDSKTITWNKQPTVGAMLSNTSVAGPGAYDFDLTSLARNWYSGTTKNYGVMLRLNTETEDRKSYRSSDYATDPSLKPKLTIEYTIEPIGKESFWTSTVTNVNTYNGNFFLCGCSESTDIHIPGRGIPASVERAYNSRSTSSGIFGYGWTSNLEQNLKDSGDGPILYTDADGTPHTFTPNGDGTYEAPGGIYLELVKNPDGTYVLTDKEQTRFHFNVSGRLTSIVDANGNTTTISNTGSNPTSITDASGRAVTLTYDANNRVTKVTDPANRTVEYTYSITILTGTRRR